MPEFASPNSNAIIYKEKTFSKFFVLFLECTSKFKHFEKKMIVIPNVFPIWQTLKNLVRTLSKERRFGTRFGSQDLKSSQIVAKSPWKCLYHVLSSLSGKLIWKMSPLVLCEILGVFFNTLLADGKYPVQDCENLQLPIQMQLSEKRKTLSWFFVPFMESTSNFKHFEKKGWLSHLWYFRNYRLWKSWLDHSLKSTISEHALTVNMS